MLDIKFISKNQGLIKENNKNRGVEVDLDELLQLDEKRRSAIHEIEQRRNQLKSSSKTKPSPGEIKELKKLGVEIKLKEEELRKTETQFLRILQEIPNLTHPETPIGGENDFHVMETIGELPKFGFIPKDHELLMQNLDMIDFERGAKVAESKFYFAKNDLVLLDQALLNYGLEKLMKHGFILMETPDVAKNQIIRGAGFSPRGPETQIYSLEKTELSLIGTAEITLAGYHADEVLDLSGGPKKYAGISHCFRTEAGAYGRESKGLYRVHQFTKLEMFVYCKPENSEQLHRELLDIETEICGGLEIPYRVIEIASRDLGAPAYRKFDIEAWMVMKNEYGEITSASNCTDYQARRLNIKYRSGEKNEFVHTLNGTAVVLSRFPLAIVENHQQKDGSIKIPEALQKFMGKDIITAK